MLMFSILQQEAALHACWGPYTLANSVAVTGFVVAPFYLHSILTKSDLSVPPDTTLAIDLRSL